MNKDVLYTIILFCDFKTCVRWSQVSKYWNMRLDDEFWHAKAKMLITITPDESWVFSEILKKTSWLWILRSRLCFFQDWAQQRRLFGKTNRIIIGHVNGKYSRYCGEIFRSREYGFGVTFTNNSTYVGEYIRGIKEGFGILNVVNMFIYTGRWMDGIPHGSGKCVWTLCGINYVGNFNSGKMHGFGTLVMRNGLKYVGAFDCGYILGKGTLSFTDRRGEYIEAKGRWKAIVDASSNTLFRFKSEEIDSHFVDYHHISGTLPTSVDIWRIQF